MMPVTEPPLNATFRAECRAGNADYKAYRCPWTKEYSKQDRQYHSHDRDGPVLTFEKCPCTLCNSVRDSDHLLAACILFLDPGAGYQGVSNTKRTTD
jgi:hypothetical protein